MIITFIKIFCSPWFPFPNLHGTYGCWTQFWWCGRVNSQFTWRVICDIWIWIYCRISRKPCTSSRHWITILIKKPSRNLENNFNSNIIISNNLKTWMKNSIVSTKKKEYKGRVKRQIFESYQTITTQIYWRIDLVATCNQTCHLLINKQQPPCEKNKQTAKHNCDPDTVDYQLRIKNVTL